MEKNVIIASTLYALSTMQKVEEHAPEETTMIITNPYKELSCNDPIDGREARRKRRAEERKRRKQ